MAVQLTARECTRRLYRWEERTLLLAYDWQPMGYLETRAWLVSLSRYYQVPTPELVWDDRPGSSWCDGDRIAIKCNERYLYVVLHEFAHYLQKDRGIVHGPAFCNRYLWLLIEWLGRLGFDGLDLMAESFVREVMPVRGVYVR